MLLAYILYMKIILFMVVALFTLVSYADVTPGSVSSGNGFMLGGSWIGKGTHSLGIDTKYNLFSQNDVIFVMNNKTISVPVPTYIYKTFKEHGSFNVSAGQLKSDIGMIAKNSSTVIKKVQTKETDACTYCGYCHSINMSTGQLEYGYSTMCTGTREYLSETTYLNTNYSINFTDKSGKVVGTYSSKPIPTKSTRELKELRGCL